MTGKIVVYGSDLCPMVPPVRNLLQRAKVDYDYISISRNRAARAQVMEINDGNASVPTLVFPDGSTLTEPKLAELTPRLEALGHTVSPETFGQRVMIVLQDPKILMFGVVFLAIGLATGEHSLTVAGGVLLVLAGVGRLPWVLGRGKDTAR
jgi:mycoredoxin